MASTHGVHLPHIPHPHVGQPQDQAHRESTKPSPVGGLVLGAAVLTALVAWGASLVVLLGLGPSGAGTSSGEYATWTAVAISSAITLFLLGIWKAHRA